MNKKIPVFPVDAAYASSVRKVQKALRIIAGVRPKETPRFFDNNGSPLPSRRGAVYELHPTKGRRRA